MPARSRARKKPAPPSPAPRSVDDFLSIELGQRGWSPNAVAHILAGHPFALEGTTTTAVALAAGCDNQPGKGPDAPRNVEACLRALRTSVALVAKLAEDLAGRLGPVLAGAIPPTPNGSAPPPPSVPLSLTPLAANINDQTAASNGTAGLLIDLLARAEV